MLGAQTLLVIGGLGGGEPAARWRAQLWRASAALVAAGIVLSFVALGLQAAAASGRPAAAWEWTEWRHVIERTRFGAVWQLRLAAAVLLLGLLLWRRRAAPPLRAEALAAWALAAFVLCVAAWSGHGAAVDPAETALTAAAAHLLAAGVWAGALPWLAFGLARAAATGTDALYRQWMADLLRRFSGLATLGAAVIVASGMAMSYLLLGAPTEWPARADDWVAGASTVIEGSFAPLLSTRFGGWVLLKMALLLPVLWLAAAVRWRWMPALNNRDAAPWQGAHRSVRTEALVVAFLLWAAANAAGTIPAAHDVKVWPLPFRVSLAATWGQPGVALWLWLGAAGLVVALALSARDWAAMVMRLPAAPWRACAGAALALASACALIWALSVPAWPRTYLRSEVPYDAVSIARGIALYRRHCADCHGAAARGDGPLAVRLAKPPTDLAEPHTALHTGGDIFHWLTDGKPDTPMPGFAHTTSAEDRWDIVNFLRLFSSGFQARILTPSLVPGRPWLGAPNFDFTDAQGRPGSLKDLRGQVVLLVFYTLPASQPRLLQLAEWQAGLAERGVQIVAVPLPGSPAASTALPFIAPVDGAADAATAYLLLRRTLADAGKTIADESPHHMEFLIDRFGYARSRWLPSESPEWADAQFLLRQGERLREEPRLMPPPDDHVH